MEFEGIVIQKLQPVSGTSARGQWKKQEVIFEQADEYNRKICVGFWGDKADDAARLTEGEKVLVSANVESREYNGRWYTEIRAWKMDRRAGQMGSGPVPAGFPEAAPAAEPDMPAAEENYDDLPF